MFNSTYEGDSKLPESKNPAEAKKNANILATNTFALMHGLQDISPQATSLIRTPDRMDENGKLEGSIQSELLKASVKKFHDAANTDYRGFIEYDAATMAQVEGTAEALINSAQQVRNAIANNIFSQLDSVIEESGATTKGAREKLKKNNGHEIRASVSPQAAKYMRAATALSEVLETWKTSRDNLMATLPQEFHSEYHRVREEFAEKTAAILTQHINPQLVKSTAKGELSADQAFRS